MSNQKPSKLEVILVPVGVIPEDLLEWLSERLPEAAGVTVITGESVPLPPGGNDVRRGQYLAEMVMRTLDQVEISGDQRVIGLIDADCFAPEMNFIFGQAMIGGCQAFVALPRLRESFYARSGNLDLFRGRVLKESVHELGHTIGLHHCSDPFCVMHFSSSLRETDIKTARFCPVCQAKRR
jgi:archaemetzincin